MHFRILGPLQVHADSVLVPVRGPREQKILAMLTLHADHLVSLERLISVVWDEDPPATAGVQVRNRISGLRKSWAAGVPEPETVLATEGNGYLLRMAGHDLDLISFQHHVTGARDAASRGDHREAARLLRLGLGLWRGPALGGLGGAILTAEATALEERRLSAIEDCIEYELALGQHDQLAAEALALAEAHPFRERLTHHLVLAMYRSGRQADALAHYSRYVTTLRDELGLDPSLKLRALHEAVLRRSSQLDLPSASAPAAPVAAAVSTSTAPQAGRAAAPRPAELPADVVDFAGRARELDTLDGMLSEVDDPARGGMLIVAVTGTAGVGKTALAIRWAHRVAARFPDGQLHVNLQGYSQGPSTRPTEALATMLRALGARTDQIPVELDEMSGLFRSLVAGKRMLLLLDNADAAEQVRPLLPGSSGCLVVVTSRDRLSGLTASHGARRLTVHPLASDEAAFLINRILGPSRVAREPEATAQLVRACAALPLALRIAAANLDSDPHSSIAAYVAELQHGDRFSALSIGGDSQAVQPVFDVSYAALSADTRRVFRLIGLAPGPDVSKAAVAAMAGVDVRQAAVQIDRLAAAHLIQVDAHGRFTAHDLLRLYMKQRAEAEDDAAVRASAVEALLTWHLDHARAAARTLHPHMLRLSDQTFPPPRARFVDHVGATAWLDRERPNLVAIIDHAAEHGPYPIAWMLADLLRGYFWLRGHIVDWLRTAHVAREAAAIHGELRGQAAAFVSLAFARYSQGNYEQAGADYQAALELSTAAGWEEGKATALGNIGLTQAAAGDLRLALESLGAAADIDRRLGRSLGLATTLRTMGSVTVMLGHPGRAIEHLNEALTLYEQAGSLSGQAMTVATLANALRMIRRHDEAMEGALWALDAYRSLGDMDGEAGVLEILACIHLDANRPDEAMSHATAALAHAVRNDRHRFLAAILNTMGRISVAGGDSCQAVEYYQRALVASSAAESRYHQVEAEAGLAAALQGLGQHHEARVHAYRTLDVARNLDYRIIESDVLATLADIELAAGDPQGADAHGRASRAIRSAVIVQPRAMNALPSSAPVASVPSGA